MVFVVYFTGDNQVSKVEFYAERVSDIRVKLTGLNRVRFARDGKELHDDDLLDESDEILAIFLIESSGKLERTYKRSGIRLTCPSLTKSRQHKVRKEGQMEGDEDDFDDEEEEEERFDDTDEAYIRYRLKAHALKEELLNLADDLLHTL
jgi:hypothetical protein